ncbi:response regulator transcription factor [Micrococcales bacterium 31B]|nr:response regulator transcription factor [Micrococcales bacterium 31B]
MQLLLLSQSAASSTQVLPALELLPHTVKILPCDSSAVLNAPPVDAVLVDATRDLMTARAVCRALATAGLETPVIAVVTEGGLAVVQGDWGLRDFMVATAGPAEIDARLRVAKSAVAGDDQGANEIEVGDVLIDENAYTVRLRGEALDLTYKEFELLRYLAQSAGRVMTRAQLLQEVWGYDYFGGTRTVDVHVRRLRAKLGPECENLIATVRNVGYRFDGK